LSSTFSQKFRKTLSAAVESLVFFCFLLYSHVCSQPATKKLKKKMGQSGASDGNANAKSGASLAFLNVFGDSKGTFFKKSLWWGV